MSVQSWLFWPKIQILGFPNIGGCCTLMLMFTQYYFLAYYKR